MSLIEPADTVAARPAIINDRAGDIMADGGMNNDFEV